MNLIERLALQVYALPNSQLSGKYDKAIIIDYAGEIRDGKVWLPSAEILSLEIGARLLLEDRVDGITWANTSARKYPFPRDLQRQKIQVVTRQLNGKLRHVTITANMLTCTNTIDECQAHIRANGTGLKRVILIGDWRHIPRTVAIWKLLLPQAEIAHISVDGQWTGSRHPSLFVRWNTVFILMNLVHHALLKIFGLRWMGKLKQAA